MRKLVRSTLSGVQCTKCDNIIPVGVDRYITGKMHHCFICPKPVSNKPLTFIQKILIKLNK